MTKLFASAAVIVGVLAPSAAFAAEKTITLAVQHMTCAACPGTVKKSLLDVPGVTNVVVSAGDKTAVSRADNGAALHSWSSPTGIATALPDRGPAD